MLETLRQVADGIAAQFGSNCEVAIHDLSEGSEHPILYIVNGHVSGRSVGDHTPNVLLEQKTVNELDSREHLSYMMKTPDGKILKTSAIYIKDDRGKATTALTINFDVSKLLIVESALHDLVSTEAPHQPRPEKVLNVNELLENLIQKSVELVGKPVAAMNKDDKIKAIQFLSKNGAFLVTKSGDKIAKYFGISKYTLYSYIDAKPGGK